jgi:hypothetical protein
MRNMVAKKVLFEESSIARPASAVVRSHVAGREGLDGIIYVAWRGNENSANISVAILRMQFVGDPNSDAQALANLRRTKTILDDASIAAPALAVSDREQRVFMAWTGINNYWLNFAEIVGPDSESHVKLLKPPPSANTSFTGPALVWHGPRDLLYAAWAGDDDLHSINIAEIDLNCNMMRLNKTRERTHQSPALLSSFSGRGQGDPRVILAWTGTDQHLNTAFINLDELDVEQNSKLTYDQLSDGPPALVSDGPPEVGYYRHYIGWSGVDGIEQINIANNFHYNLGSPQAPVLYPETFTESAQGGLSLVVIGARTDERDTNVQLAIWTGIGENNFINVGLAGEG